MILLPVSLGFLVLSFFSNDLHAFESDFSTLKADFSLAENLTESPAKIINKDMLFVGQCFHAEKPSSAEASTLFLFAPVKPFIRQVFAATDGAAVDETMDKSDLEWVADTLKERRSAPLVQIDKEWQWTICEGYGRNKIKLTMENNAITKVLTKLECTGTPELCDSCNMKSGEWQYCSYKPFQN